MSSTFAPDLDFPPPPPRRPARAPPRASCRSPTPSASPRSASSSSLPHPRRQLNRKALVIVLETEMYVYDMSNMRTALCPRDRAKSWGSAAARARRASSRLRSTARGRCLPPRASAGQSIRGAVGKPHGDAANKSAGNANGNGGTSEDTDRNASRDDSGIADSVDETPSAAGSSSSVRRRSLRLLSSLTKAAAAYLPATLARMWEPAWDFAWLRLPPLAVECLVFPSSVGAGERRCVVGLSSTTPHVVVISSDGYFYAYIIDLERGGECVLVKQYLLLESDEDTGM
ncbi:hypothetical protein B0H17DRAFT_1213389 [Mycena rosella]|uniref:Uncharacterized protein n=1 Tax=Mycena rosella TaxID=1033263 RepID=A0AAD7CQ55_MYCRO|nr:hypothetical protein B0H17DRAFT_1213389 [Mycena rosella]